MKHAAPCAQDACRAFKENIPWTVPAPKRFHDFVIDQLMSLDPAERPTSEEAAAELKAMVDCLDGWVDRQGYIKAPYRLEELTTTIMTVRADTSL